MLPFYSTAKNDLCVESVRGNWDSREGQQPFQPNPNEIRDRIITLRRWLIGAVQFCSLCILYIRQKFFIAFGQRFFSRHVVVTSYATFLYMTSHVSREKSYNLCWKGNGRTPIFGIILKTKAKLIKNRNELLLVCYLETNKFNQKQFG